MEAIDPIRSYIIKDIVFDIGFDPCVLAGRYEGVKYICWLRKLSVGQSAAGCSVKIDLDSFHKTVKFDKGSVCRFLNA